MNYWVLKAESADGAIIDALPKGSPTNWKFSKGEPLVRQFPLAAQVAFSDHFSQRHHLYDFVRNTIGVLLVSSRVLQVLQAQQVTNMEFLPVTICNHQWTPVAEGYGILNVLGCQPAIDMQQSDYRIDRITKREIARLQRLVLAKDAIDPTADLFRAQNMMELFLISDRLLEAFIKAGLTGFTAHPTEGFDDMF